MKRDGDLFVIGAFLFFFSLSAFAEAKIKPCAGTLTPNQVCLCSVSLLRPTQSAVGYAEVERKRKKIEKRKIKPGRLEKYLSKNPEPVVVGPGNELYITDHHHLARALLEAKVPTTNCRIELNLAKSSPNRFWQELRTRNLVYLFDEDGKPIQPASLPNSINDLKDDPFRSIAGQVRERGGYRKTKFPFSEFAWANFFRSRLSKPLNEKDFAECLKKALILAKSQEAKELPGYFAE